MSRTVLLLAAALLALSAPARPQQAAPGEAKVDQTPAPAPSTQPARRRGFAEVEVTRPRHFPHRIWAVCDFEVKLPSFGLFGKEETADIPAYPGNATARRGAGPYQKVAALMTGCNPVPGPRMGTSNYMYCRYRIRGGDRATFQHYSLTRGDNNHINVTGLTQGKWSELTLNFTRDARRNDGSSEAFQKGERMDDLKVFVGKPDDGKSWQFVLDDVIFFSVEPGLPPEEEPFPNRVLFLAAFDTGVDPASKDKFFPGRWEAPKDAPPSSYWGVAAGVAAPEGKGPEVLLQMAPPRPAAAHVKLRFRYWVRDVDRLTVALNDATAELDRTVQITPAEQGKWVTRYVDFTKGAQAATPIQAGNKLCALKICAAARGERPQLYVDEVVLFEPGPPVKEGKDLP